MPEGVEDIKRVFWNYCKSLAKELHTRGLSQVVYGSKSRLFKSSLFKQSGQAEDEDQEVWERYFSPDKEVVILREACPIHKVGPNRYAFNHDSLIDYFATRDIYDDLTQRSEKVEEEPGEKAEVDTAIVPRALLGYHLNRINVSQEESKKLVFLADRVQESEVFKRRLFQIIEYSKQTPAIQIAAANAISALNAADIPFSGMDLRKIRVPGANLDHAIMDGTQLQGADLSDVSMQQAWLYKAKLNNANMEGVELGEYQRFNVGDHTTINLALLSPNGELLCAVCGHSTIKVWDFVSGEQRLTIQNKLDRRYSMNQLVFYNKRDEDGLFLVSVEKMEMKLWSLQTGVLEQAFNLWTTILNVGFLSQINALIVVCRHAILAINVNTFEVTKIFSTCSCDEKDRIISARLSHSGDRVIFVTLQNLTLFNVVEQTIVAECRLDDDVTDRLSSGISYGVKKNMDSLLEFSPDDMKILFSIKDHCINDNNIHLVYQVAPEIRFIKRLANEIMSCSESGCFTFTPDGQHVIASLNNAVALCNIERGKLVGILDKTMLEVATGNRAMEISWRSSSVTFGKCHKTDYLLVSIFGNVWCWKFDFSLFVSQSDYSQQSSNSPGMICFDNRDLIALNKASEIRLLSSEDGSTVKQIFLNGRNCVALSFSNVGDLIACVIAGSSAEDVSEQLIIINVRTSEKTVLNLEERISGVVALDFSPNDSLLVLRTRWNDLFFWNIEQEAIIDETRIPVSGGDDNPTVRVLSDDLVIANSMKCLHVYVNGAWSREVRDITRAMDASVGDWQTVNCLDGYHTENNSFFVVGDDNNGLIKYPEEYRYKRHSASVTAVTVSPDGNIVASGGADGVICLWSSRGLKHCFCSITGHCGAILELSFVKNGRYLVSTGKDREIHGWEIVPSGSIIPTNVYGSSARSFEELRLFFADIDMRDLAMSGAERNILNLVLKWRIGSNLFAQNLDIGDVQGLSFQQRGLLLQYGAVENRIVTPYQRELEHFTGAIALPSIPESVLYTIIKKFEDYYRTLRISDFEDRIEGFAGQLEAPTTYGEVVEKVIMAGDLAAVKYLRSLGLRLIEPLYANESVDYLYQQRQLKVKGNVTPFLLACWCGHLEIIHYLVYQVDVNFIEIKTHDNMSAIHFAAESGKLAVIQYLFDMHNFELDEPNDNGCAPISIAAQAGHLELVKFLVVNGADIKRQDSMRKTPLDYAREADNYCVVEYLEEEITEQEAEAQYKQRSKHRLIYEADDAASASRRYKP